MLLFELNNGDGTLATLAFVAKGSNLNRRLTLGNRDDLPVIKLLLLISQNVHD